MTPLIPPLPDSPNSPPDDPAGHARQSLSRGAAGIALLHIENARRGTGDWATVHTWVKAATRHPVTGGERSSLYFGALAIAYLLALAARPAYAAVMRDLDDRVAALIRSRLACALERHAQGRRPDLREFDLISGLTGLGAYLLLRLHHDALLRDILAYLVRLTEPVAVSGTVLPGWWSGNGPQDRPSSDWPGGHGNLGMAHGIAVISGVNLKSACQLVILHRVT